MVSVYEAFNQHPKCSIIEELPLIYVCKSIIEIIPLRISG